VEPQDLKYKGEDTQVIIGDDNVIREYVTVNRGTGESGKTVIGNKNLFMAYTHVAHDCLVHDNTVIANVGTLAGHVTVENKAVIGGLSAVHQFVRVGRLAIVGGCSKVVQDIPPFSMVDGHPVRVYGLNSLGLKRAGIPLESMRHLKIAFKFLFSMKLSVSHALKKIQDEIPADPQVAYLVEFINNSKRGICRGALRRVNEED
jgi:Acyl-[acyl carrier protein]--UDP-N-acetylglucosamine O-acyltransferase